ncbi:hypothetical protein DB347_13635 [Opitutaceae bacterium EW11]|nr:hypothetical protein DB347_13635 [Opitutaceae bacterium EW11]
MHWLSFSAFLFTVFRPVDRLRADGRIFRMFAACSSIRRGGTTGPRSRFARACRLWSRLGFAVTGAGLLLGGCGQRHSGEVAAPLVQVIAVAPRAIQDEVVASGTIEAVQKSQLGFLVPGRIVAVDVEEGTDVVPGQLLARLEDSDYRDQLAASEARLTEVKARFERINRLHELGSATATDFEKLQSGLTEAQAAVDVARRRVEYTRLTAPFAGRVVRHGPSAGTVVAPGTPVLSVLAPAPVWATVGVPEAEARKVQVGQPAHVILPAVRELTVTGPVEAVLPQADPLSRSYTVKVRLENSDGKLPLGAIVTARIDAGGQRSAILIPPQVVHRFPDGALFVWVIDPQRSTVSRRIVGIGPPEGSEIEIVTGLEPGDRVVRTAPDAFFDGMPVRTVSP